MYTKAWNIAGGHMAVGGTKKEAGCFAATGF